MCIKQEYSVEKEHSLNWWFFFINAQDRKSLHAWGDLCMLLESGFHRHELHF